MNLEHIKCNLCGRDDVEHLFTRHDYLTNNKTNFNVVRCKHCSLVYVNPRPSVDDIHLFYPEDFVSYQFEELQSSQPSFRERLVAFVTRTSAAQHVEVVRTLVEPTSKPSILDVGCGKGSFLYALKNNFECDAMGIDFDEQSVRYCRERLNINVLHGGIDTLKTLVQTFDLVTMWHFFEHEFDPSHALEKINPCLKQDGVLVIKVPNAESLENTIFGKHSYQYDVPRHLYNYSPTTIGLYLEKAGFEVQSIKFDCFSGGYIGTIQELVFRGRVYKDLKANILLFLALSGILFPIDYLMSKTSKGSIMTVVARKKS